MKNVYPDNGESLRTGRKPGWLRFFILVLLAGLLIGLLMFFPAALRFVEMAAREVRYLWWLILMVVLGVWLIWGVGKSSK